MSVLNRLRNPAKAATSSGVQSAVMIWRLVPAAVVTLALPAGRAQRSAAGGGVKAEAPAAPDRARPHLTVGRRPAGKAFLIA